MEGRSGPGKRRHRSNVHNTFAAESEGEDDIGMDVDTEGDAGENIPEGASPSKPVVIVDSGFSTTVQSDALVEDTIPRSTATVGSALKRNADGTVAALRISNRKPKSGKVMICLPLP